MEWHDGGLVRDEAEALLRDGCRWRVSYCWGAHLPDETGVGMTDFPRGVLSRIPTPAAARRIARGRDRRTWFTAHVLEDEDGPVLLLAEP